MLVDDQGLEYWGIISVELIKGEVDFYRIREAKPNPKAKLKNKMSLLWKSEFSHILAGNKLPKYAQKSKKFITEKLLEKLSNLPESVMNAFMNCQFIQNMFSQDFFLEKVNVLINKDGEEKVFSVEPLKMVGHEGNNYTFEAELSPRQFGQYKSAVRMYPKNKLLPHRQDFCYVKWLELPATTV